MDRTIEKARQPGPPSMWSADQCACGKSYETVWLGSGYHVFNGWNVSMLAHFRTCYPTVL